VTRRAAFQSLLTAFSAVATIACGGTLDAGTDRVWSQLPISANSPLILTNDSVYDNWQGEYALLMANDTSPPLAGIIVSTGGIWTDVNANLEGWQDLVASARASGLAAPTPLLSPSQPLMRPDDGEIESTTPNDSAGARFIVETSRDLYEPDQPIVVATGGRLTDVADAYLLDPTVAERVVVIASLGTGLSDEDSLARMGIPNGEMDTWAGDIVARKFAYVQVSGHYDQLTDVTAERTADLPDTPLGEWIAGKREQIATTPLASDQVSILVAQQPTFPEAAVRVSAVGQDGEVTTLGADPEGSAWLVPKVNGAAATERFWQLLGDSASSAP
jgi:hypothetical protein